MAATNEKKMTTIENKEEEEEEEEAFDRTGAGVQLAAHTSHAYVPCMYARTYVSDTKFQCYSAQLVFCFRVRLQN